LEEEHGNKQKKLPWNKNLNLDSATIVLGTHKNKCMMVDLEGENVTKSNYIVEEAYDYTHPLKEAIIEPYPFAPLCQTHSSCHLTVWWPWM
jgi:hypothetical protein